MGWSTEELTSGRGNIIIPNPNCKACSGACQACLFDIKHCVHGGKGAEEWSCSPQSSAKFKNERSCTSTLSYAFIPHTQGHFIITFHTHSFWYSKQVTVYNFVTSHKSPFWDHTLAASGLCINSKTSPVIHTKMYTILPELPDLCNISVMSPSII
jgi:hypothetical protein